jgi:hypothetical protein
LYNDLFAVIGDVGTGPDLISGKPNLSVDRDFAVLTPEGGAQQVSPKKE